MILTRFVFFCIALIFNRKADLGLVRRFVTCLPAGREVRSSSILKQLFYPQVLQVLVIHVFIFPAFYPMYLVGSHGTAYFYIEVIEFKKFNVVGKMTTAGNIIPFFLNHFILESQWQPGIFFFQVVVHLRANYGLYTDLGKFFD
jgi:hypothetical protein